MNFAMYRSCRVPFHTMDCVIDRETVFNELRGVAEGVCFLSDVLVFEFEVAV